MTAIVTVCTTCRSGPDAPFSDGEATAAGMRLALALEQAVRGRAGPVRIVRHECLWACAHGCAILIRAEGKIGYIAGRFRPTAEAAAGNLDWTEAYQQSAAGTVRYELWPEGIKGHFIARIPTLPIAGPSDSDDRLSG
ncbi:MAG: DUF1636 domain-containing protein [Devosia sp.]|nr:DUF1636 domain-containing protein [Devosia sp.]